MMLEVAHLRGVTALLLCLALRHDVHDATDVVELIQSCCQVVDEMVREVERRVSFVKTALGAQTARSHALLRRRRRLRDVVKLL